MPSQSQLDQLLHSNEHTSRSLRKEEDDHLITYLLVNIQSFPEHILEAKYCVSLQLILRVFKM